MSFRDCAESILRAAKQAIDWLRDERPVVVKVCGAEFDAEKPGLLSEKLIAVHFFDFDRAVDITPNYLLSLPDTEMLGQVAKFLTGRFENATWSLATFINPVTKLPTSVLVKYSADEFARMMQEAKDTYSKAIAKRPEPRTSAPEISEFIKARPYPGHSL